MFKIGQEVVCIKSNVHINGNIGVKRDKTYTILNIIQCKCGNVSLDVGISMSDVAGTNCGCGRDINYGTIWYQRSQRFRPIQLDHAFANEVIAEIIELVKEEELVKLN